MYYVFLTGKTLYSDSQNAYFCNSDASLLFLDGGKVDRIVKLEIEKNDLEMLRELYWSQVGQQIVSESAFFGVDSFVKLTCL